MFVFLLFTFCSEWYKLQGMPKVNCVLCKKEFSAKPFWIKKGYGKYCSTVCQYEGRKKGEDRTCETCGKISYKQQKAIKNSKSGKFFCGKSCQTKWRNGEFAGILHANYKNGNTTYRNLLLKNSKIKSCMLCDKDDLRILAVHHIDKNRSNNDLSNLAWLCHNCHFLVHHFKDEEDRFDVKRVLFNK